MVVSSQRHLSSPLYARKHVFAEVPCPASLNHTLDSVLAGFIETPESGTGIGLWCISSANAELAHSPTISSYPYGLLILAESVRVYLLWKD